jgi:hypothetical protein
MKEPSLDVGASYVVVHGNKDGKTKAHERSSKRKKLHALVMELKARNDHDEKRLPEEEEGKRYINLFKESSIGIRKNSKEKAPLQSLMDVTTSLQHQ